MAKPDIEKGDSFTKELAVNISDEEKETRKMRLAEVVCELGDIEAAKAKEMAGFNADLKDKHKEMRALASSIRTGQEKAEVECYEELNYTTGNVVTKRSDTGEQIDERAMTLDERNEHLPGMDGGGTVTHLPPGTSKKRGKKAEATDETAAEATH